MTKQTHKKTTKKPPVQKKKGPKRHIRKSLLIIPFIIASLLFVIIQVPDLISSSRLKKLGYTSSTIENIKAQGLTATILEKGYYSDYLVQSINDGSLNKEYMFLYNVVSPDRGLTDADFLLYSRLEEIGYEADQLENLYANLDFYELTPLLIYDYQWDESRYIDDCKTNHGKNNLGSFTLDGDYLTAYKIQEDITNFDTDMLVNEKYTLPQTYAPADLSDIDQQYAVPDMKMESEAARAYTEMAAAAVQNGTPFFASRTYVSYDDQAAFYQTLSSRMDEEDADVYERRPGHSEHQTGLSVRVVPTFENVDDFTKTDVYAWLHSNCTKYGFIERYPLSKSQITRVDKRPGEFRYVGKDLAEKVKDSGLTYDEYYCLYLKDWDENTYIPPESVLDATGASRSIKGQEKAEETAEPQESAETEETASPEASASADTQQ